VTAEYSAITGGVAIAWAGEGARVGLAVCAECGAAVLVHPRDSVNRIDQHFAWHASHKIGVERTVPHALASSASVPAVEQSATAHAAAPVGTEAPST
jgi:hypothetical protein